MVGYCNLNIYYTYLVLHVEQMYFVLLLSCELLDVH